MQPKICNGLWPTSLLLICCFRSFHRCSSFLFYWRKYPPTYPWAVTTQCLFTYISILLLTKSFIYFGGFAIFLLFYLCIVYIFTIFFLSPSHTFIHSHSSISDFTIISKMWLLLAASLVLCSDSLTLHQCIDIKLTYLQITFTWIHWH